MNTVLMNFMYNVLMNYKTILKMYLDNYRNKVKY